MSADRSIPIEIMKHEPFGHVSPLFAGGESIDRELQAFIGVFLRLRLASFVINDDYVPICCAIHTVNAANESRTSDFDTETLFIMENVRLRRLGQEFRKLGNSLLLIQIVLVAVSDSSLGEVCAELIENFGVAFRTAQTHGFEIGVQDTMHRGAVLQGGGRIGGNAPLALQFESQWANLVALQCTGAQSAGQIGGWRSLDPLSYTR